MTRRFATFLLFLIGLAIVLMLMGSCSSAWKANMHLRKAEKHIRKAEALGAHWSSDTLYRRLQFTVPGVDVKFIPKPISFNQEMTFERDSVKTTVLIRRVPGARDTVIVHTICPPRVVTKVVPMEVNKEIKAEKQSLWQMALNRLILSILCFAAGYFFNDIKRLTFAVLKK